MYLYLDENKSGENYFINIFLYLFLTFFLFSFLSLFLSLSDLDRLVFLFILTCVLFVSIQSDPHGGDPGMTMILPQVLNMVPVWVAIFVYLVVVMVLRIYCHQGWPSRRSNRFVFINSNRMAYAIHVLYTYTSRNSNEYMLYSIFNKTSSSLYVCKDIN